MRRRVSLFTPPDYRYADRSVDYDDWSIYCVVMCSLVFRAAATGDESSILSLYESLSPESRYTRFFTPMPRFNLTLRTTLTALDGAIVWLAFDDDICVGEARVVLSKSDRSVGDIAVTVADDYQHHGIGNHLMELAIADARTRCVDHFMVSVLPENGGAARMARRNNIRL